MDRYLKPDSFDVDPQSPDAGDQWQHWYKRFSTFLSSIGSLNPNKLDMLINHVSPAIFKHINECRTYDEALCILESLYIKPKNEIFARHVLSIARQESGQTLEQFLQHLKSLSKDCNLKPVSAEQYRDELIRDAFIRGLRSNNIRQRLLEQKSLNLNNVYQLSRQLEMAQQQSTAYETPSSTCHASAQQAHDETDIIVNTPQAALAVSSQKCFFCGYARHPRANCPAKDALCKLCGKKGHFHKVCRSTKKSKQLASVLPVIASGITTAAAPASLSKAITTVSVNGIPLQALIDTGSSESFISYSVALRHHLPFVPFVQPITLASTDKTSSTKGYCTVSLVHENTTYTNVKLSILNNLCSDVLLGHDFLCQHKSVEISFHGKNPPFSICNLSAARLQSPSLFANLDPSCKPICTKSRRHTASDELFIQSEIDRLLSSGIIEPSTSPWRAQVLITTNDRHKKRMVIDYSQTINRFTYLDAYPLPRLDAMIEKISQYRIFSTLDLQSAYHQIPILENERHYTAFEAAGNLYHFLRIPFGVTNGVACFQRAMDEVLRNEGLKGVFVYVDNITICGKNSQDHDANLKAFLNVVQKYGFTLNETKCIYSVDTIRLLGYEVSNGTVKPDPDRFKPLLDLPAPKNLKAQQRIVGMFAYYSQWISRFSDKIYPLVHNKEFPLPSDVLSSYELLKSELVDSSLVSLDRNAPLVIETDASDVAIAATLTQNTRPVAFFSRTLSNSERHHSAVEKEAYAIIEAVRRWRHYLLGTHFKLITDQRSVAFMYQQSHNSKIKNDKVQRWRIEMSQFSYDVVYRPGADNTVADALSRAHCSSLHSTEQLKRLHDTLCHPGVARLFHFIKAKNLPFSLENVKTIVRDCRICAEIKPRFYKPNTSPLIKATQPFERLSIDFKGPVPSASSNKYILTVIDEFSRFPFAFACPDMTASTVIAKLTELFCLFGMPAFLHSDRGSSFMSKELKDFLHSRGIATSRTTSYNPQCNGQVERLNGTLWKAISLYLRSNDLPLTHWEHALHEALHSIRSLLCTATNATPHERMFTHNRRSSAGTTLPQWLLTSGPVLLRRNSRVSKYEPLVEEVELLECNPEYAHVRLSDGREENVSLRNLAPLEPDRSIVEETQESSDQPDSKHRQDVADDNSNDLTDNADNLLTQQQRTRPYCLRNREA